MQAAAAGGSSGGGDDCQVCAAAGNLWVKVSGGRGQEYTGHMGGFSHESEHDLAVMTDRAAMLDEIMDYVKFLRLQVKVLSMSRLGGAGAVAQLVADIPLPSVEVLCVYVLGIVCEAMMIHDFTAAASHLLTARQLWMVLLGNRVAAVLCGSLKHTEAPMG